MKLLDKEALVVPQRAWETRRAYCVGCGHGHLLIEDETRQPTTWLATDGRTIGVCVKCEDQLARWYSGDQRFEMPMDVAELSGVDRAEGWPALKFAGVLSPALGLWVCPTCSFQHTHASKCPTCCDDGCVTEPDAERGRTGLGLVLMNFETSVRDVSGARVKLLDIRSDGSSAGICREPEASNPYVVGSVQWVAWLNGYDDAIAGS